MPAATVGIFTFAAILAIHVARTLANGFAGHGWQTSARSQLFSSLPGLLAGDASTGLAAATTRYATDTQLWAWITASELALGVMAAVALRWWAVRWGRGRILGMATPAEVEQLLGRSRLRRNANVIRPDLYGSRRSS